MRSVVVVLPASMCATMPMLRSDFKSNGSLSMTDHPKAGCVVLRRVTAGRSQLTAAPAGAQRESVRAGIGDWVAERGLGIGGRGLGCELAVGADSVDCREAGKSSLRSRVGRAGHGAPPPAVMPAHPSLPRP